MSRNLVAFVLALGLMLGAVGLGSLWVFDSQDAQKQVDGVFITPDGDQIHSAKNFELAYMAVILPDGIRMCTQLAYMATIYPDGLPGSFDLAYMMVIHPSGFQSSSQLAYMAIIYPDGVPRHSSYETFDLAYMAVICPGGLQVA